MKTSIVPAQVTTVEDKIAANMTVQQMVLLIAPFFFGFLIFVGLPPFIRVVPYKLAILLVLVLIFTVLAIRIRGKLVMEWAVIMLAYNLRPRYYVYDKNDAYLRSGLEDLPPQEPEAQDAPAPTAAVETKPMSTADRVKLEDIMANPDAKLHYKTDRKGAIRAYITEVKQ